MRTIRVGGIGYGYWGPNLLRNFIEIAEAEMLAVADLKQDRLKHLQERYPQIRYTTQNYTDLFELGLDAVVISTPPHTHYQLARECLERGLHVLVEKPMALSGEHALQLIELAAQRGLVLMVGHTFEYNPAVRALKEMIDSGTIGEVQYVDMVRVSLGLFQTRVNVIWDLAPHDLSILNYLFGSVPLTVQANGHAYVQKDVEDVAYLSMGYANGVTAHTRLSWLDPRKTRCITIVGTKKMLVYDDVESLEKIRIYDKAVAAIRHTETFGEFQFAYHYGDVTIPYIRFEEPLRLECLHFLECIREGKEPLSGGYDGLRVIAVIEAAQQSLRAGGIPMPVVTPIQERTV